MTDYSILANHIVNSYLDSISGKRLEDEFVDDDPMSKTMLGKLAPHRILQRFDGGYEENPENKFTSIPSINISFSVKKNNAACLFVQPRGILIYNVQPNYEKTVDYILRKYSLLYKKELLTIEDLWKEVKDKIEIPLTYKAVHLENCFGKGLQIDLSNVKSLNFSFRDKLENYLSNLENEINARIKIPRKTKISVLDLLTEQSFRKATEPRHDSVNAHWQLDIHCKINELNDSYFITLQMVNRTAVEWQKNLGYVPVIFDAGMTINGNDETFFLEVPMENLKKSYKKSEPVRAISENTSYRYEEKTNSIITENAPRYIQYRLKTKPDFDEYVSFDALLSNPIGNLKYVADKMSEDLLKCQNEYKRESLSLSSVAKKQFEGALDEYDLEIKQFKKGIMHIEYHDLVAKAFNYMLQTFKMPSAKGGRDIKGWRLFQIVFIVSLIPDVYASETNDASRIKEASLLYFPTGGGKTEAFLGVCVFTMFFDRLRGKEYGVSALLKYPLRLLAVQQLDRVLSIITKANAVLASIDLIKNKNKFSLGFYVGKDNTPNSSKDIDKTADKELLTQRYKFIEKCPYCGEPLIEVRYDEKGSRLRHFCKNPECGKELPLLIVDDEIYRYLPSLIVCIVDKMATVGLNYNFKALLGQVKTYCPVHGFSTTSRCECLGCRENIKQVPMLKDPVPTLFIQDEMHLIKESLGTFDAHYESFIDYYTSNLIPEEQRKQIKFIGATATISRFRDHVWNLYHKEAKRFPCEYPSRTKGQDFYSYTDYDDISRIMTGFAPYGTSSIIDGTWRSVYEMHKVVYGMMKNANESYRNLKAEGIKASFEEYKNMLLNYWIELVYNNRKGDADELMSSFINQANNFLKSEQIPTFNCKAMTSDNNFQDVRNTLAEIEDNQKNIEGGTNLVLATSTISHGVDIDSFNSMFFFGMPNNNAEYIQAYSRVGRKYTGIIVDIIRLMRLRDRSYLKNFVVFHENKEEVIETIPINRWAREAIYCSLPGLLWGVLEHYYLPKLGKPEGKYKIAPIKEMIDTDIISSKDVSEKLINIYGCNSSEKMSLEYEEIIKQEVCNVLEAIKIGSFESNQNLSELIKNCSKKKLGPMTSLRYTEEQVSIDLQ